MVEHLPALGSPLKCIYYALRRSLLRYRYYMAAMAEISRPYSHILQAVGIQTNASFYLSP